MSRSNPIFVVVALLASACNQPEADLSDAKAEPLSSGDAPASTSTVTSGGVDVKVDGESLAAGSSAGDCAKGSPCVCSGLGTCAKKCPGGGCNVVCANTGTCDVDCPGGDCSVKGTGMGTVNVACDGGGCSLTCTGTGACTITSCKSGCSTSCTGSTVCKCPSGC